MNHYLMKYVGLYRVLPELDIETHDIPRDANGNIDEDWDDLYIACYHGGKISFYGHDTNGRALLTAYIPTLKRGRLIVKALQEKGVVFEDLYETDCEVEFRFKSKYISQVAECMKAKTIGASISPFSVKNLPRSNVQIPSEKIEEYKAIIAKVNSPDILLVHRLTQSFLSNFLQKKQRKIDKNFDYRTDMKRRQMARQYKEYIFVMGCFDDYLKYMKTGIQNYYGD